MTWLRHHRARLMNYERLGLQQCPLCGMVGVFEHPNLCALCWAVHERARAWARWARRLRRFEEDEDNNAAPDPDYFRDGHHVDIVERKPYYADLVQFERFDDDEGSVNIRHLTAVIHFQGLPKVGYACAFDIPTWPTGETVRVCGGVRRVVCYGPGSQHYVSSGGCGRAACGVWRRCLGRHRSLNRLTEHPFSETRVTKAEYDAVLVSER